MRSTTRLSFFLLLLSTHWAWVCSGRAQVAAPPVAAPDATPAPAEQGKVLRRSYFCEQAGQTIDYALYVPTTYRPDQPAPLLVLLHGLGSNPFQVLQYLGIIDQAEKRGYLVVAPMGYNSAGWYGSQGPGRDFKVKLLLPRNSPANLGALSEQDVLNVLDLTRQQFRIDPARTYLMGHSMGGGGTLYLGMKYPTRWAALAALSPAIFSDPAALKALRRTPVMVVQGEKDLLVKVENTRRWVAKMAELAVPHEYVEIKGGDHLFSIATNPKMIERVFDFFEAHHR